MRRLALPLVAVALGGCAGLTEENGIAAIEIRVPRPAVVEVGQTIQLHARALNQRGDSVPAEIVWRTPDTTVTLTLDGQLTGRTAGQTARVQAQAGPIVSDFVTFTVEAPTSPAVAPIPAKP